MVNNIVRIGIIGCGGIANGKHMPALQKVADCEMVAFCDIVLEKAEKAAKEAAKKAAEEAKTKQSTQSTTKPN